MKNVVSNSQKVRSSANISGANRNNTARSNTKDTSIKRDGYNGRQAHYDRVSQGNRRPRPTANPRVATRDDRFASASRQSQSNRRPVKSRKSRRRRKLRRLFALGKMVLITTCLVVGVYFYYDYTHRIYDKCQAELGSSVKATDFLKNPKLNATFTDVSKVDMNKVGVYPVKLKSGFYRYKCELEVTDTVPPDLVVKDVTRIMSEPPNPTDFIESAADLSGQVNLRFASEISMNALGNFPVKIIAEDSSGNTTEKEANLKIVAEYDTVPPVIEGQLDKTIYTGAGASFKTGVTVTDNEDVNLDIEVDSSQVDLDVPGQYTITYRATDSMGNVGTATGIITVVQQEYTEDQINGLADEVLAEIINDGMSDYDKAKAIYGWVKTHMGYSESGDQTDWIKAAYNGLTRRHGDCYDYYAVSRILLTRAGIKNDEIGIVPTATRHHFWNVIDCGEGWRHFDTTPRVDKSFNGFYLTDEELTAYSKAHHNSHNFDRTVYNYFN